MGNYSVNVFEKAQRWVKSHLFLGTKCVGMKCSGGEVCRGRNVPGTKCAGDEVCRGRSAPGTKCSGDEMLPGTKCARGRNVPGDEVFRGRNVPGDEVFPGTKCTWGRNGCEPIVHCARTKSKIIHSVEQML